MGVRGLSIYIGSEALTRQRKLRGPNTGQVRLNGEYSQVTQLTVQHQMKSRELGQVIK